MNFITGILNNKFIIISLISLILAQALKMFTFKGFKFTRILESGGMPSSHSSTVTALTTTIGMDYGYDSVQFAMAFIFSIIVMYDASGVRLAVGKQAKILNNIISEIKEGFKSEGVHIFVSKELKTEEKLKELIGHTKIEVFVGAFLGIVIANILFYRF